MLLNRITWVSVLLAGMAGESIAQSGFDARAAVPAALEEIARLDPSVPLLTIAITEDPAMDGLGDHGLIRLSDTTLRAVHTPQELYALLAIITTYAHPVTSDKAGQTRKPNLGEYLGALAFAGLAEAIDPINPRDPQDQYRRQYTLPGNAVVDHRSTGTARGRAALRLISKAGSCSGAALKVLGRLRGQYRSLPENRQPPLAQLAVRIRSQFGALAMPPDDSCIQN